MSPTNIVRKFTLLLEPRAKREIYGLCGMAVAAAFLEMLAVASVVPFLATLANPQFAGSDPRLAKLHAFLGFGTPAQFLAYLGGIVLLVLIVANAFSAATAWRMLRFANRQGHALSMRMLATYLRKPYVFYLDRNIAELQKNVFGEVYRVTNGILIPSVQVVTKLSVVLFLGAMLVLINPLMALIVAAARLQHAKDTFR